MIKLRALNKQFKSKTSKSDTKAVNGIDLDVAEGKLTTLLGPSGCGKTTTLRLIAGLERPDSGEIVIGDTTMYSSARRKFVGAHRRPIGFVFQSYAIWPHMTVLDNVVFPLRFGNQKTNRAEARRRALEALDLVDLADYAGRPAPALSGGQQQRVALARAIVREPKVLLLDEPLSNLDAGLRDQMRAEIRSLQQRLGITTVLVTHDQHEALAISDEIVLLNKGVIVEKGLPQEIYAWPRNEFTARFLGVSNAVAGVVVAKQGQLTQVRVPGGVLNCRPQEEFAVGEAVTAFLHPENFSLTRHRHSDEPWEGYVQSSIFRGDSWDYHVKVGEDLIKVRVFQDKIGLAFGDQVFLEPKESAVLMRSGSTQSVDPSADAPPEGSTDGRVIAVPPTDVIA